MLKSIASRIGVIASAIVVGTSLAVTEAAAQAKDSGFLKDYSQLKNEKDSHGVTRRIWVSPKLTRANYQKVMMDPITFYPSPQPTDKVSMETLDAIRAYADRAMRTAMSKVEPLADAPGPGVLRCRTAITAVDVKGSLKPYQLVPVALVVTGVKEASGSGRRDLHLYVESEFTDSVTGEPVARAIREARGVRLKSSEHLTLEHVKPQLDRWADATRQSLAERLK